MHAGVRPAGGTDLHRLVEEPAQHALEFAGDGSQFGLEL